MATGTMASSKLSAALCAASASSRSQPETGTPSGSTSRSKIRARAYLGSVSSATRHVTNCSRTRRHGRFGDQGVLRRAIPAVHRVSSHAWYHRPCEERARLGAAVQTALSEGTTL